MYPMKCSRCGVSDVDGAKRGGGMSRDANKWEMKWTHSQAMCLWPWYQWLLDDWQDKWGQRKGEKKGEKKYSWHGTMSHCQQPWRRNEWWRRQAVAIDGGSTDSGHEEEWAVGGRGSGWMSPVWAGNKMCSTRCHCFLQALAILTLASHRHLTERVSVWCRVPSHHLFCAVANLGWWKKKYSYVLSKTTYKDSGKTVKPCWAREW